jgi:nucleotide-binding universal stress UspA family protein
MGRTIVVATDFSAAADEALDAALGHAVRAGASVELLHVYEPTGGLGEALATGGLSMEERESGLAARARRAGAYGVRVTTRLETGRSADAILQRAREVEAVMIALGTHGRTGLARAALGSVAETVLRHASCPVFVVPSAAVRPPAAA